MRKYIFLMFIIMSALHNNNLVSCPCEFSADDERPFFEQYEVEDNSAHAQKKDEKS
jgi:predicted secreted protein